MWVFTKYGFVSVVCRKESYRGIVRNTVVVRARIKGHLERIKSVCRLDVEIRDNEGTDYAYRMVVGKSDWKRAVAHLADDIDYTNFKDEAEKHVKFVGKPYVEALHRIWSVMYGIQGKGK